MMNIPDDLIERLNKSLVTLGRFEVDGFKTTYVHSVTIRKNHVELMIDVHDQWDAYCKESTGSIILTFNQFNKILDELNSARWRDNYEYSCRYFAVICIIVAMLLLIFF